MNSKGMRLIYLDYAAATPLDPLVLEAMRPYFLQKFYNPSATYRAARSISQDLNQARSEVANWLGCRPPEIVFTAGGTEANNLSVHGVMKAHPRGNIVVSGVEHESVLRPAENYDCRKVGVLPDGRINLVELERSIDEQTTLVSIIYANNEIGTVQPLREIAKIVQRKRESRQKLPQGKTKKTSLPLYFHTDACQAAAYLDLHVNRLGVDMMTLNGGKIYGPKQSGALFIKTGVVIAPQVLGGGQEHGRRSGTENVPGDIGFARALSLVQGRRHQEAKRLETLRDLFIQQVEKLPGAVVNGSKTNRLANNVHVSFAGRDNERLMMELEEGYGIICAVGSACSASKDTPSHVLSAIGLDQKTAQASLRFSFGRSTSASDIRQTVAALAELVE